MTPARVCRRACFRTCPAHSARPLYTGAGSLNCSFAPRCQTMLTSSTMRGSPSATAARRKAVSTY